MSKSTPEIITIRGTEYAENLIRAKVGFAASIAVVGGFAVVHADLVAFAVVLFALALAVPFHWHTFLDVPGRRIATLKHYAWFTLSEHGQPLSEFSSVVVRHLCITDGEGVESFAGGVGLKPMNGKAVLWVKKFPATGDEFPHAANDLALRLAEETGLPVRILGNIQPGGCRPSDSGVASA